VAGSRVSRCGRLARALASPHAELWIGSTRLQSRALSRARRRRRTARGSVEFPACGPDALGSRGALMPSEWCGTGAQFVRTLLPECLTARLDAYRARAYSSQLGGARGRWH
jgi:hypothetical protein